MRFRLLPLCPRLHAMTGFVCLVTMILFQAPSVSAQKDDLSFRGRTLVFPYLGVAFPTGRFGETDISADPPKSGHMTGYGTGIEAGYFINEYLAVGMAFGFAGFDIDFGDSLKALFPTETARTTVRYGQVWGRVFFADSYRRWRPYVLLGVGIGRPRGEIEYTTPFLIPVPDNPPVEVKTLESTVGTTVAITGGIGVMVPLSRLINLNLEPRYISISSKGKDRSDRFVTPDGEMIEIKGEVAKSNTNWWEIRGGVVFTIL